MSTGRNTVDVLVGLKGRNLVDCYSMTGTSPVKTLVQQSIAAAGHNGRGLFSQPPPARDRICDDHKVERATAQSRVPHDRSYVGGNRDSRLFTQTSQPLSVAGTRHGSIDGDAVLIHRNTTLKELSAALDRHGDGMRGNSQFETAISGLSIVRSKSSVPPARRALKPAVYMMIEGEEWSVVGQNQYEFRAGQAFILSVEDPGRCTVPVAGTTGPCKGLLIELDREYTHQIIEELHLRRKPTRKGEARSSFVIDLNAQLLDCALRAVRLLDTPEAIPLLYPAVMREICYWLLTGPASDEIIDLATESSHDGRVLQAIQYLRGQFNRAINVEHLATTAGMSPSTFHRQFKSVTQMSPMQYLKHLRLFEARRLMITSNSNVESVANEVGYLSASQFSREYARMFGKPPRRDMSSCRSSESASPNIA